MKLVNFAIAAGTLALGLATLVTPSKAQGPLYDTVYANIPYTVTVGDRVMQPGSYVIKELPSRSKSRVVLIYSHHGERYETSVMTFPIYDILTRDKTELILHHFGPTYYFDRIWIEGKNYGYEFPLPRNLKYRQKEELLTVNIAARYQLAAPPQPQAEAAPPEAPPEEAPAPAPEVAQAPPPRELPKTSAGWLMMLLSGGTLSAAGLLLRRRA